MGRERLRAGRVSAKAVKLDAGASRRVAGAVFSVGGASEGQRPVHEDALDDLDNANCRRAHADAAPVPLDHARVFEPLEAAGRMAKGVARALGELAGGRLHGRREVGARVVRE
jgi:hypothetical protein